MKEAESLGCLFLWVSGWLGVEIKVVHFQIPAVSFRGKRDTDPGHGMQWSYVAPQKFIHVVVETLMFNAMWISGFQCTYGSDGYKKHLWDDVSCVEIQ